MLKPPSMPLLEVLPHDDELVPVIDCVAPPCVQLMLQPEPLRLDEQVAPPADSVPQRHSD